jgi:hypothetical protein
MEKMPAKIFLHNRVVKEDGRKCLLRPGKHFKIHTGLENEGK